MANVGTLHVNVVAHTANFMAGMGSVRQQLRLTSVAAGGISGDLSKMVGVLGALGPAAAAVTALAIGVGVVKHQVGDAVSKFAEFEHSMSRVKAIAETTDAEFQSLWQQARKLGSETVFSANQVALAQGEVAQAGLKVNEMLAAMPGVTSLASAGELELADAARIATGIMAGFKLEAKDMTGVADLLAKASIDSKANVQQLGESMQYVGAVAHSSGFSIYETVAALEVLAEGNLVADMAGTGLRGTIAHIADQSDEAAAELERLQITLVDTATGGFLPLADIVDQFNEKLGNVGAAERIRSLFQIFDVRAANAFAILMDQGSEKLREFEASVRFAGGTSAAVAAEKLDNLRGEALKLTKAIDGLKISMAGGGLGGVLRDTIALYTQAIQGTKEFGEAIGMLGQGAATKKGESFVGEALKTGQLAILEFMRFSNQAFGNDVVVEEIDRKIKEISEAAEKAVRDAKTAITDEAMEAFVKDLDQQISADFERLAESGQKVTEAMRTPAEALQKTIGELNEMVTVGVITWETYGRAVDKAIGDTNRLLESRESLSKPISVGAVAKGTTAAFSAERQATAVLNQMRTSDTKATGQRAEIIGILDQLLKKPPEGGQPVVVNQVKL